MNRNRSFTWLIPHESVGRAKAKGKTKRGVSRVSRAALMAMFCLPALLALTGCGAGESFRTMNLGPADPDVAFVRAKILLEDHFVIDEADASRCTLTTQWQYTSDDSGRSLLVTRQRARLELRREGGATWADLRIPMERMLGEDEIEARRYVERMQDPENAHLLTPAMLDAPYTPSQRVAWRAVGCNRELELELLSALHQALNPPPP